MAVKRLREKSKVTNVSLPFRVSPSGSVKHWDSLSLTWAPRNTSESNQLFRIWETRPQSCVPLRTVRPHPERKTAMTWLTTWSSLLRHLQPAWSLSPQGSEKYRPSLTSRNTWPSLRRSLPAHSVHLVRPTAPWTTYGGFLIRHQNVTTMMCILRYGYTGLSNKGPSHP